MGVRVSVVGRPAVARGDVRVRSEALTARRTRLLLVALATADGPLSAQALADRLWTAPPATWPASLRGAVGALRSALTPIGLDGQRLVITDEAGWRLADDTTTDLHEAEVAVRAAEEAIGREDVTAASTEAEAALALLAGEVLPGDDGPWIADLRARRASGERRALAAAAESALRLGRLARADEAGAALLLADPLDESAHRRLIRVRVAAGDRAGAIRAFDRCRSSLTEALGVDPSPETTALYLQVLQSGSGPSGALPPRPRNRFVGRALELEAVRSAFADARCVLLLGRGGIGKSRLALEAAHDRSIAADGGRFWASLGDVHDSDLVPAAIAEAVGADGAVDPLAGLRTALAPAGRVLLVLDGCEAHRDLLAELVPRLLEDAPQLVVLCTSRVRLDAADRRVPVGPLEAGPDLLSARLAEGPLPSAPRPDAAAALCERLGGVPLAIELAAGRLSAMSVDDLLDDLDAAGADAGDVLATLVAQSYAALDADEALVLRGLAVIDGAVPLALARSLAGPLLPGPRVARVLGALAEAGFVTVDRAGVRWRYGVDGHLRPAARGWTPEAERVQHLASLERALAGVAPLDATAPPGPFRDAVLAAGDGFRTLFAAAAAGEVPVDEALRLAFRLHRHWAATSVAEGRFWLDRLLEHVSDSDSDSGSGSDDAALARFAAGYLAYWAGDSRAGGPLLRRAGDELEARAPAFAARALLYAAGLSDDEDEPARALAEVGRAVELARVAGGGLVASVELGVASILAERGDRTAVAAIARAVSLLPETAPSGQRLAIAATGALAAWRAGDAVTALRLAREAEPLSADGPSISRAVLAITHAGLALADGRVSAAEASATAAIGDLQEVGADREVPLAAAIAARAAADRGDADSALGFARTAVEAARGIGLGAPAALAIEAVLAALPRHPAAGALAASAAAIRRRGDRPPPPGLRPAPAADADPLPWQEALDLASDVIW